MSVYRQNAIVSRQVASKGTAFLGVVRGAGFDADTLAFALASGATSLGPLDAFVRGLKSAGLWGFIRSWPMLPGQNAGSGATVYGLGGLNGVNGNLTGSPAWNAGGVELLSASSQRMDAAISSFNSRYSVGAAVTMMTSGLGGSCIVAINGTSSADSVQLNDTIGSAFAGGHRQVAGSTYIAPPNQPYTINAPAFVAQGWDGSATVRKAIDGANTSVGAPAFGGAIAPLRVNCRGDALTHGQNKRVAFAFYLVGAGGTDAEHGAIRDLYKSTLGAGLGLP